MYIQYAIHLSNYIICNSNNSIIITIKLTIIVWLCLCNISKMFMHHHEPTSSPFPMLPHLSLSCSSPLDIFNSLATNSSLGTEHCRLREKFAQSSGFTKHVAKMEFLCLILLFLSGYHSYHCETAKYVYINIRLQRMTIISNKGNNNNNNNAHKASNNSE